MKPFTLEVITPEKHILTDTVTSLTINTQLGEITVLANHIPLFARLAPGEMSYSSHGKKHFFAVTGGFIDISPRNIVTILADSAIRSDQINLAEAEAAVQAAQRALVTSPDQKTSLQIEIELRSALLKTKVAKKHQSSR